MPVKVGKGKKKKGKKKKGKGGKRKKGKRSKSPAKLKKIAGELSTDQLLQYKIMKEDRFALQQRAKQAEDKNTLLDKKLKQLTEDQTDIFENLRSKVEKSKAYAKVLLDQRDVLEREKKDSIEALESQLEKRGAQYRNSRGQLKMLKERWQEQQGRMKSAAHTLAVRAEMEEKTRTLEKQLKNTNQINDLRESQNSIISSVEQNAEIKAVTAMLLECIKQFPTLGLVQRESIQSLTKILNLKNSDLVLEANGIELVIRAIRTHRNDVTLLAACCRLLWRLYVDADHHQVCVRFAKTGARDEVLTSLQTHPSDRHLHYNVVGILRCMLGPHAAMFGRHHHTEHNQSRVKRSGSLPTLQHTTPETTSPPNSRGGGMVSSSVGVLPDIRGVRTGGSATTTGGSAWPTNKKTTEEANKSFTIASSQQQEQQQQQQQQQQHHRHHKHHHHHHHTSKHHRKHHSHSHSKKSNESKESKMVAPHKQKQWRSSPKRSDIKNIVGTLLQCMDMYSTEDTVVEKCVGVLSILIFDETEKEALTLPNYEDLRSNEKAEAARGLALEVIEQVVPGGEKELVSRFVEILKIFSDPEHGVLQGMILLLIQKILPEDPEVKTIYLRTFKEMNVNTVVFETLSLPHAMADADLKGIGLWILEYFAMPPPGRKKKKKKVLDSTLANDFRV